MADIDIEADARQQIEDAARGQGGSISNFNASQLRISTDPPEYDPPVTASIQPRQLWTETYKNCTRQARTEHIVTRQSTSNNMSIELGARLKVGRGMSSRIDALETVTLGSNFSIEVDLTATTRYSRSWEVSKTIDESTSVAPCTEVRVGLLESGTTSTVAFRIVVRVSGNITCTFVAPHFWEGDVDMTVPYSRRYVINGTATVNGVHLDKTWSEYRAQCDPGTPCARLAGVPLSGVDVPPTEPPAEHAETGSPGLSEPSPQAIWNCGDEFPVVAEGKGADDQSAEAAAFENAREIARTQCPTTCPAQFVRKITVKFSDAPGEGRRAKWYGVFACRQ